MSTLRKVIKISSYTLATFVLFIAGFTYWAVGTTLPKHSFLPVVALNNSVPKKVTNNFTVMTFNMGHGQGVKDDATDYRDKNTTIKQTKAVADVIKRADADVVFLQELDLASNRTHYIDQLKVIQDENNYPFHACALVWVKNYLPFPYLPIKHHIGRLKSANCILSRFVISDHEMVIFDKPASNPFWYNWGYLDRGAQKVVAQIGDARVNLVNIHLDAWDIGTRALQVEVLKEWLRKWDGPLVMGGDFNAIPPEATKKGDFFDEPGADFKDDHTIEKMIAALKEMDETMSMAITPEARAEKEKITFTFRSDRPLRQLDYLFAMRGMRFTRGRVLTEAREASDHLPVLGKVEF